jgi:hypothetical protein
MAKGGFMMGFNVERNVCIANVTDDLRRLRAYFAVKPVHN